MSAGHEGLRRAKALAHRSAYGNHWVVTINWPDGQGWMGLDPTLDEIAAAIAAHPIDGSTEAVSGEIAGHAEQTKAR